MLNSHDQFRDAKQTDKVVFDLATKLLFPEIQKVLVRLLNKANKTVKETYKSKWNITIAKGK